MAALTSARFASFSLVWWSIISISCEDIKEINCMPGEDISLDCQTPKKGSVTQVAWSRPDLLEDRFVFLYRSNRVFEEYQESRYVGRVMLRDPGMTDGNVSIFLKNITVNDTGTYECRVVLRNRRRTKRNPDHPTSIIKLMVTNQGRTEDGGDKDGGNKDGGYKYGGDKDGGDKDGGHKDGGNKDGGKRYSFFLLFPVCLFVVIISFVLVKLRGHGSEVELLKTHKETQDKLPCVAAPESQQFLKCNSGVISTKDLFLA